MKKLHYSITIQAPRALVWDTMLTPETYTLWTAAFCEGSKYEGSWDKGSIIVFLDPNGQGMKAMIAENLLHERISIQHLACLIEGKEEPFPEPAFENYTLRGSPSGTELLVELDTDEKYEAMFLDMWPRALVLLKNLCEKV